MDKAVRNPHGVRIERSLAHARGCEAGAMMDRDYISNNKPGPLVCCEWFGLLLRSWIGQAVRRTENRNRQHKKHGSIADTLYGS